MHTWFSVVITSGHIECAHSEGLELEGFIKILLIPLQHSLSVDIAGMFLGVYNLESCLHDTTRRFSVCDLSGLRSSTEPRP